MPRQSAGGVMLLLNITSAHADICSVCVKSLRLRDETWLASEFCIKMVSASASVPRVFWRAAKIDRQDINRFRDCPSH
ncbi:hypothetical protein PVAP13_1KG336305 [Panicum virgatum]|uniref:Secreted protein n=1 Tax=Panicum virgatum TaxID=38727 RepID=A0A8T0XGA4_PANVG|nr:hypothetical protein PVAP13_1KG336305 [Panicum virgatum]